MRVSKKVHRLTKSKRYRIWCYGPEYMSKREEVFKSKKRKNYKKILEYLEVRSVDGMGDLKVRDEIISEELSISIRTVQEGMAFLERHGYIIRISDRVGTDGNHATIRFIRVFTVFFDRGCQEKKDKWENDFRPRSNLKELRKTAAFFRAKTNAQTHLMATPRKKFKDDPDFVPEDVFMNKMYAQNTKTDFSTLVNVDVAVDNAYNMAHHTFVPEEVIGYYMAMKSCRDEHVIGQHSDSVRLLGYPDWYDKRRRKNK